MAPSAEPKSQAVAISGLAPTVTEAILLNTFRVYGPILRISLNGNGGAHIVFERRNNAYKAATVANGSLLNGNSISVTVVREFRKTVRPCKGFLTGSCRQGDKCKYLHIPDTSVDIVAAEAAAAAKLAAKQPLTAIPKVMSAAERKAAAIAKAEALEQRKLEISSTVCEYYQKGQCLAGGKCRFQHTGQRRSTAKCTFFAAGLCKRGDACAYLHEVVEQESAPAAAPAPAPAVTAASTTATTKSAKASPVAAASVPAAPAAASADADRTCIECEETGVAKWQCSKCDEALYCDACYALVHKSKVMKTHERVELPPVVVEVKNPVCDECEEHESSVKCEQCDVVLCATCDASVHKFKSLRSHIRVALAKTEAAPPAPQPVAAKRTAAAVATAAPVVLEPAVKKQKILTPAPVAAPARSVPTIPAALADVSPELEYVESVPRYDLTSESESESDDDDADEDDDDNDDEKAEANGIQAAAAPAVAEPMDVDSDSSEGSDDDDEPPVAAAAQPVKPSVPVLAASTAATASFSGDISSESSDDEDERPVVLAAPVRKTVPAPKPVVVSAASESSDSSDDEDEKPRAVPTKAVAAAVAAKQSKAPINSGDDSSSSSSSDSDDDDDKRAPVARAPVAKAPAAPAKRAAAPKATRGSGTPGISTGSSHSLVKKIEAYFESGSSEPLHLDANLNGFERLLAHDCAERLGLAHKSVGEGLERHITISRQR